MRRALVAVVLASAGCSPKTMTTHLHQVGAEAARKYTERMTPLAAAAKAQKADEVRALISRGADVAAALRGLEQYASEYETSMEEYAQSARDVHSRGAADTYRTLSANSKASAAEYRRAIALIERAAQEPAAPPAPPPAEAQASPAPAPSDADSPRSHRSESPDDFALVIGIEKYPRLPGARYAENDADAVKAHLLALGYPERNIVALKGGQATRGAIQGYVEEWLPKNAKPASRVVVYFSGHGSPDPKTGAAYLVPSDGDTKFLRSTAYPLASLYAALAKLKARRVLVALDSCFSGAGGRSVLPEGARPLVARIEAAAVPAGLTVLTAAAGDEIAGTIQEQGHGAFTYHLLKALDGGKLTAKAAFDELKPRVQDEAHRQNREQTPQMLGDDASF